MDFAKLKKIVTEAKMIITTISFLIASVVGGYQIVTRYFVTKAYANELIGGVKSDLEELKKQTNTNHKILLEMRMIRLETKQARGDKLTPTEVRVYERLKKEYISK